MRVILRYGGLVTLFFLAIPLGTIYRQNIETWAASQGLDGMLSGGVTVLSSNPYGPWLLFMFVFILGGTATLWLEFFLRKKVPTKFSKKKALVEEKTFKHTTVVIDGRSFKDCSFDGAKLIYNGTGLFDFVDCNFGDFSIKVETEAAMGAVYLMKLAHESGRPITIGDIQD